MDKKPFIEINTEEINSGLASYGLDQSKVGEIYALKVVERRRNFVGLDIVRIQGNVIMKTGSIINVKVEPKN